MDSDYDAGELLGSAFSLEHLHIEAFGGNLPLPISSQLGEQAACVEVFESFGECDFIGALILP